MPDESSTVTHENILLFPPNINGFEPELQPYQGPGSQTPGLGIIMTAANIWPVQFPKDECFDVSSVLKILHCRLVSSYVTAAPLVSQLRLHSFDLNILQVRMVT